ncbi:MAG: glycosyltransferase involved in cell wall biosynthesis [Lentimonas sp.]|jgi:glycosyltransferase involved in cell wall biosynthesis
MEHICIDVAIPNYRSPFLANTLDSVLSQKAGPFELNIYVVDDGSNSIEISNVQKSYEAKGIKFYYNEHNLGLVGNFNKCLEHATNDYVHILHADDMVEPTFYQRISTEITLNPALALIACASRTFDGMNYTQQPITDYNTKGIFEHLKYRNCLIASAVVLKTNTAKELQFRDYAPHACDWDMWARIAVSLATHYITDTLHTYRDHASNDTSNYSDIDILKVDLLLQKKLLKENIFRKEELFIGKNGIVNSAKYRIANLILKGSISEAFSTAFFILTEVGVVYFIKTKLGVAKVLLSKVKHLI